jgi:hypothetical protein
LCSGNPPEAARQGKSIGASSTLCFEVRAKIHFHHLQYRLLGSSGAHAAASSIVSIRNFTGFMQIFAKVCAAYLRDIICPVDGSSDRLVNHG